MLLTLDIEDLGDGLTLCNNVYDDTTGTREKSGFLKPLDESDSYPDTLSDELFDSLEIGVVVPYAGVGDRRLGVHDWLLTEELQDQADTRAFSPGVVTSLELQASGTKLASKRLLYFTNISSTGCEHSVFIHCDRTGDSTALSEGCSLAIK